MSAGISLDPTSTSRLLCLWRRQRTWHKSTARSNSAWALTTAGGIESGSYKSASDAVLVGPTSGLPVSASSRCVAVDPAPARAFWDWELEAPLTGRSEI